jgi:hypothetical protein
MSVRCHGTADAQLCNTPTIEQPKLRASWTGSIHLLNTPASIKQKVQGRVSFSPCGGFGVLGMIMSLIEPLVTRLRWQAGLSTKQTNVCLLGGKALWRFPLHDRPPEVASFCLFFPVYFILCFFTLHHHGVPSNTIDTHLRKKFKRNRTSRGQSTSPCFSSQVVLLYLYKSD